MTPDLWERLKPLYHAAQDLPEESRTGYVDQMCGTDAELARELRALLAADRGAQHTLDPLFSGASFLRPVRPPVLEPGTLLANRFRIVRHLGSGGMGDVYEALDLQLEQGRIALKTIRPDIAGNPAALARFKDEVLLARKITGPNVCRIHELYLTEAEHSAHCTAFLTMELLDGMTLYDRIEQAIPIPVSDMRRITEQLCAALGCIHEAGIIHRDLKPRNVMLVPHPGGDKVVVMDFGLARATAQPVGYSGASLAAPGLLAGTPSYMAPEQFEGGEVGPPTDIYALGLILYEMATGLQPYAGHTPLAAAIRRSRRPQAASSVRADLPPVWDDVIQRCLEYDPPLRFQTTQELLHAIQHPDKVMLRLGAERRLVFPRTGLIAAGIAVVVFLVLGSWMLLNHARQRRLSPEAAHWYALGMTALREGSYLKATRMLTLVTQRDPTYPLAHAALADAWTELDFTNAAQREMLLASSPMEQRGLTEMDRRYIDAVRSTLVRDYSAAAQDYEAILNKLPEENKAQGYVDLGRIYEKAGRMPETVASYEKAARLNPDDPAPFLHLGILKSRLRDRTGADEAFSKAESLYGTEGDQEGLAEVAYQHGYAANEAGMPAQAKQYLQRSLTLARQLPSAQLEVRSLSQLSSVAYSSGEEDQALAYANQVAQIARDNGLEYWAIDAMVRTGNAYVAKGDYAAAEAPLQAALAGAQQNGHPRLQASAELTLASLRYQEDRFAEQIKFARSALSYYADYGFLDAADRALILIGRGERELGDYDAALKEGLHLVEQAQKVGSAPFVAMGEELLGGVLLNTEHYPDALMHYKHALETTEAMGRDPTYQQIHYANTLWRLGRYDEAEAMLEKVSPAQRSKADIRASIVATRAEMLESRGNAKAALALLNATRATLEPSQFEGSLQQDLTVAQTMLGSWTEAKAGAAHLVAVAQSEHNPADLASGQMMLAEIGLHTGNPASALAEAEQAEEFFRGKGKEESQALSLLLQAEAAHQLGQRGVDVALSRKSLDIFWHLQQSWGVPVFRIYATRPDRRQTMRALGNLCAANGAPCNVPS